MADAGAASEPEPIVPIEYREVFGVRLQQPCDMPDDVVRDVIDICRQKISTISVSNWQVEGDAALVAIKDYLDNKYLPQWTVAAGKHFGTKITHDSKHFISFYLGDYLVVIFRCT